MNKLNLKSLIAGTLVLVGFLFAPDAIIPPKLAVASCPVAYNELEGIWINPNPQGNVHQLIIGLHCSSISDLAICSVAGRILCDLGKTGVYATINYRCGSASCNSKEVGFRSRNGIGAFTMQFTNQRGDYAVQLTRTGERIGQLRLESTIAWTDGSGRSSFSGVEYLVLASIFARSREPLSSDMLNNINFPGLDYANFRLSSAEPALCQAACRKDGRCQSWTYVRSQTTQGPQPVCWLKSGVPDKQFSRATISGVVRAPPPSAPVVPVPAQEQSTSVPQQPLPTQPPQQPFTVFPCSQPGIGRSNLCVEQPYPVKRGTTAYVIWRIESFKQGEFDRGDGAGFQGPIYGQARIEVPNVTASRTIRLRWIDLAEQQQTDEFTIAVAD